MIRLLTRIFAKNCNDNAQKRRLYGLICGFTGIALNIILFIFKIIAGILSGSVAITADAVNNLSDAGSSIIAIFGIWLSGKKPDTEHPFGHGRFEYVSGLAVSMLILLMGVELGKTSIEKIIHPSPVEFNIISIIILVVSICVKLYMMLYNRKYGKEVDSATMLAISTDSLSDSVSTLVVLISMLVCKFANLNIDGWCGLLVALFILYSGIEAAKDTVNPLLGQVPDKEFVDKIKNIVLSHDRIIGIHDLVVHDYGPGRIMVSLHAEIPCDANIIEMHDLIDNIENDIAAELFCEAVIHMDPININDEFTQNLRKEVGALLKEINPEIQIHDFRIVSGTTHTNLIFDAVVPTSLNNSESEIKQLICGKVKEKHPDYFCVVKIDRSYI